MRGGRDLDAGPVGVGGRAGVHALALAAGASVLGASSVAAQASCRLSGTVVDDATGQPIASASVWIEDPDTGRFLRGVASSATGAFLLEVPGCVRSTLRVETLGFGPAAQQIEASPDGEPRAVTVRLERTPLEVEELEVEIGRSDRLADVGFYARQAWVESTGEDFAAFYDPEDVRGRAASQHSVGKIAASSRINFMYPSACTPSYYVDGERVRPTFDFYRWLDLLVKPSDVEGMEIFRPMHGAIPDEFREANSNVCGAVLVWTKPAAVPRVEVELCEPTAADEAGTLSGVVTDRLTGVRLPAARVMLVTDEEPEAGELRTITDEEGRFRFCDVVAAPLSIRARYGEVTGAALPLAARSLVPDALDLDVPVTPPGGIAGRLSVEGVVPDSVEARLDGTAWTTVPDAQGAFRFDGLPPGDYEVVATHRGRVLLRRPVTVRAGIVEELEDSG